MPISNLSPPRKLVRGTDEIAYRYGIGTSPTIVFLSGLRSDMEGTKASHLEVFAQTRGQAFLRFDHFGHGLSSGRFEDGTIGRWRDDALALLDTITSGPLLLVGSSMGGWLALLIALARPERVAGIVGIAAAPDFTERLMWASLTTAQRTQMAASGFLDLPSDYGEPYRIALSFIVEGRDHLLLDEPIRLGCPVRLLHGTDDAVVPISHALTLLDRFDGLDVSLTLIGRGDHRLSRPADLAYLETAIDSLSAAHMASSPDR